MKTPFAWVSLGLLLGIIAEKYSGFFVLWIVGIWGGGMILLWPLRGTRFFLSLFVLLFGCAGFVWARMDAYVPANAISRYVGPERITLRGVVETLPEMKSRGRKTTVSLVLKSRSITRLENDRRKFRKVCGDVQVFLLQSSVLPQVGDELRLYGTLSAARTVLNPGEFDYGNFLAQKNIYALFQTIGKKSVRVTKTGSTWTPARLIAETRRRLASLIDKLYKPEESAILKALVLGLRSDIASEVRSHFMKTGTVHLFATANTKRNFAPFSNKIIAAYSP